MGCKKHGFMPKLWQTCICQEQVGVLVANHLLENAFALFMGGMVTVSDILDAGRSLLKTQLQEQVLEDGMHYERSPMYQMIVLERLLDALNFAKANDDELVEPLTTHARKMTCLAMNWRA